MSEPSEDEMSTAELVGSLALRAQLAEAKLRRIENLCAHLEAQEKGWRGVLNMAARNVPSATAEQIRRAMGEEVHAEADGYGGDCRTDCVCEPWQACKRLVPDRSRPYLAALRESWPSDRLAQAADDVEQERDA